MDQGMLGKVAALRDEAFATLKALDDAVVTLGGKSRLAAQPSAAAQAYARGVGDHAARRQREARQLSQSEAAEMIMRERGEPTSGVDLLAALPSKGVLVGGINPTINFTSSMSKSGKFRSVRKGGSYFWWFKDEPLPADWQEAPDLLSKEGSDASAVGTNQEGGDGHAAT
jgi:hypothetical protein